MTKTDFLYQESTSLEFYVNEKIALWIV